MERKNNWVEISLGGEVIVGKETPTIEGTFVDSYSNRTGVFLTEKFGEVTVDIIPMSGCAPTVVIRSDALRSQSRRALRERSGALGGIREVNMGWNGSTGYSGKQDFGKDPETGKIKTLEVKN